MTNGNTVVSHTLTRQWPHKHVFSQQISELVATCTLFRLISEVPSRWRELESPGERAIEALPSLVRKCADDVAVSIYTLSRHDYTDITQ